MATKEWQRFTTHMEPIESIRPASHFGSDNLHHLRAFCGDGPAHLDGHTEHQIPASLPEPSVDEFRATVASAAHDFRNPLSIACNAARALNDPKCPESERPYLMDCLLRNLTSLQFLAEDFAERMCTLPREDRYQIFDLAALAREVVLDCASLIHTHQFRFEGTEGHINADREKIRRLLLNLVANAVKYSEVGKTVAVEVWDFEGSVCLHVHDQGKGISPAETERIFLPRLRLEPETTEGFGWGLASVKRIAEQHGAEVFVQGHPGQGSTFEIRFQAHDPAA